MRRHNLGLIVFTAALVGMTGCATDNDPTETKVVVPSAATSVPEYEGDGSVPEQQYVIRMSNGEQTWEVQFPSTASGYEMHIPLSEQKAAGPTDNMQWSSENLTEADKELIREMRRQNPQMREEGIFLNGESASGPDQQDETGGESTAESDRRQGPRLERRNQDQQTSGESPNGDNKKKASKYKPSYLLGIEEVRNLYSRGNYELAMVRLKKLEEAYPGDVRLLTMKGTLWMKLGRESLARKAWEQVLQIDPDNQQVIEALQRLNRRHQPGGSQQNPGSGADQ